jgi:hypothetical protein
MSSIYEKIVSICSRITQGRGDASQSKSATGTLSALAFGDTKQTLAKQQERRLHLRALCILSGIIKSLVQWTGEPSKPNSQQDINKEESLNTVVVGKNPLHCISLDQVIFIL